MRPTEASSVPLAAVIRAHSSPWGAFAWARVCDYITLAKPRIVILELFVAATAACLASPHGVDALTVSHALAATALIAGSASIANQWIERRRDSRMPRTADRPCAAGRVNGWEVGLLSLPALAVGVCWLAMRVNGVTAALGVASWVIYALIYTPLKVHSPLNTIVGAVAGALPLLMGWTATGASLTMEAWALATVLFLWQFPHFMAIAWLYRREYAVAGYQMASVVDPTGTRCGAWAVRGAAWLIPVSLLPALAPDSGSPVIYATWAVALGAVQLVLAILFALARDDRSARVLLRATLLFLPAWLTMLLVVSV